MRRRTFLASLGAAGGASALPAWSWASDTHAANAHELRADIVVVGGGLGGCAAALAAAQADKTVILSEETDWLGGQLSSQAVPPDEHPWIESFGCTRNYRRLRNLIREYYRRHYPLTAEARAVQRLNPGGGLVSKLCHEPNVARAVLESMLAPYVSSGRVRVLLRHVPVSAEVEGDRVRAVALRNVLTGDTVTAQGAYYLDATELGDLLPLTGTEYVTGFESQSETGEPHAPQEAQPANMQAFTWCFAVDYLEGQDHTINRPEEYAVWRDYVPKLQPPWSGRLLSWSMSHPQTLEFRPIDFNPDGSRKPGVPNFWLYRRIASKANFAPGTYASDITLVNWPQNDYWEGNLIDVPADEVERHRRRSRQLSLSLLYWMQTEAERPDGKTGWRGLRLRGDLTGGPDGLAKAPYIRESRRIRAEFTVTELHVGVDARRQRLGTSRDWPYRRSIRRFRGHWQLSYRPAPVVRRRQLHRYQLATVSDSARIAHSASHGEFAAGVQESGGHARGQRLLPAPPGRVEHWRVGRPVGGALPGSARPATPRPREVGTSLSVSAAIDTRRRGDRLASPPRTLASATTSGDRGTGPLCLA